MLIIPLHKKLTAETFPWVTAVLILLNVFVYVALQSGDAAVGQRAYEHFGESGLAEAEVPRYLAYLEAQPDTRVERALREMPEEYRPALALEAIQNDDAFRVALAADPPELVAGDAGAAWRAARARLDAIWSERFTERWEMRYRGYDPVTVTSAMFLHGSAGHLIGNMVFLALLGLLVEGAVGPWLFLGLYLLGGIGGGSLSVWRHFGEAGGALGASGAIAALMGAYCVLWGTRKVRFFWWFFVAFDYVKAPALVLLPAWLGWELFNLATNADSNVGFDVHAGGMVCGALLALAVRRLGWERRAFLDEETERDLEAELMRTGKAHLGKLEFARARAAFTELARRRPDDLEVLALLFRSWRDRVQDAGLHEAARRVLLHPATKREALVVMQRVLGEYLEATGGAIRIPATELVALANRWRGAGALTESARLLELAERDPVAVPALPDAMLALALAFAERNQQELSRGWLERLRRRYPDSAAGRKAAVLATA